MNLSVSHSVSHNRDLHVDGEDIIIGETFIPSPVMNEALATEDLGRNVVQDSEEKVQSQCTSLSLMTLRWKELRDHFASVDLSFDHLRRELEKKLLLAEWRAKRLSTKEKQLKNKEKHLDERCKEIDATYQLVSQCYLTVLQEKNECLLRFEEREKKLNMIERGLLERSLDLESQQKKFEDGREELQKREMDLRKRKRLWGNNLKMELQHLESQQKKFVQEYEAFKEKERCVDNMLVQFKDKQINPSDVDIRFYITMNGRDLHQYLYRCVDHLDYMHDEVKRALLLSANPAKLVLDAVCGIHLPNLGTTGEVLGLEVVSIFLLEQLAALNLKNIPEDVKERASLLAVDWKSKIGTSDHPREHCLKILGFWQLVGTYRLVDTFDEDEISKLLEIASKYTASRVLCESLGLMDNKIQALTDDGVVDNPVVTPMELESDNTIIVDSPVETPKELEGDNASWITQ